MYVPVRDVRERKLLIVDHQELVRTGLRTMLSGEPGLRVVGETAESAEASELCSRTMPDLVLMEFNVPETDGLDATRKIKACFPEICVLLLSVHREPGFLWEAIRAGASGYVLKDAPRKQLVNAVWKVLDGELALNRRLANLLLKQLSEDERGDDQTLLLETEQVPMAQPLTSREVEVLKLLAQGKTNRQIAHSLRIGEGTVKNHVQNVRAKLGASDRTQAVVRALELNILRLLAR